MLNRPTKATPPQTRTVAVVTNGMEYITLPMTIIPREDVQTVTPRGGWHTLAITVPRRVLCIEKGGIPAEATDSHKAAGARNQTIRNPSVCLLRQPVVNFLDHTEGSRDTRAKGAEFAIYPLTALPAFRGKETN